MISLIGIVMIMGIWAGVIFGIKTILDIELN